MSLLKGFKKRYRGVCFFAEDIVIIDETRDGANDELEQWRDTLEAKGFKLTRSKDECLKFWFNEGKGGIANEVSIGGVAIPKVEKFRYLGLVIQEKLDVNEDINQRIKVRWQKWKNASRVFAIKRSHWDWKGRGYHAVVRLALLYGVEC